MHGWINLFRKVFLTLAVLLFCETIHASSPVQVVTEVFPPFQYFDREGKLTGLSVEIVQLAEKKLYSGNFNEIEVLPWARAFEQASNTDNVLIFTISQTPSRQDDFQWVYTYEMDNTPYFWVKRNSHLKSLSWSQALLYSTAIPRLDTQYDELLGKGFSADRNLFVTNSFSQAVNMLLADRVTFLYAGKITMLSQLTANGIDAEKFVAVKSDAKQSPKLGFAFNATTSKPRVEAYKRAFAELESDGTIAEIVKKYLSTEG